MSTVLSLDSLSHAASFRGSIFLRNDQWLNAQGSPLKPIITREQYSDANDAYQWFTRQLCAQFDNDHKQYKFDYNEDIALNVVVATYDDIGRYKSFHLRNSASGARSDSIKRAAYFAKWTTKLRPIFYVEKGRRKDDPNEVAILANEILAAAYAIELIGSELGKHLRFSDKALIEFLYDLHYRNMPEDALLAFFQIVRDLAQCGQTNPIVEIAVS